MRILLVGGTNGILGGVDRFIERAKCHLGSNRVSEVEWIRTNAPYLRVGTLRSYFGAYVRILRRRRGQFDCVWFQYVSFPELGILLWCRLLGFTVVVTPHLGANWRSIKNPFLRWITQRTLGFSNGIALLSPSQAEELPLPPGTPTYNIRTFLPQELQSRLSRREWAPIKHLRLIHISRLSHEKGTFKFLEVCRILQNEGVDFSAVLVGQAADQTLASIHSFIDRNKLSTLVLNRGVLSETEVLAALRNADILVHPSIIDSYPLVVLEAIASGVYPVCADLPGARQICERYCGTLLPCNASGCEIAGVLLSSAGEMTKKAKKCMPAVVADHEGSVCAELIYAVLQSASRGATGQDLIDITRTPPRFRT